MRLSPLVAPSDVRLGNEDASPPSGLPKKDEIDQRLHELSQRLDELVSKLGAEGKRAVLVVLQGRDTSGKDGTIRKVFGGLNPSYC